MKKTALNLSFLLLTAFSLILSIWGPEVLATYRDRSVLDEIHMETAGNTGEGYRYTLSSSEKLFILAQSLNSQVIPESEQSAMARGKNTAGEYQALSGTYAFIVNHQGPSEKEITDQEIYETCNTALKQLKDLGILPEAVKEVEHTAYDTVLYSAIDVLEPRNHVSVWKLSLSTSQNNANKENRLIDAYIDADTGKIFEFYVRTALTWEDINPDLTIKKWSEYLELEEPSPYESGNPLAEITPYFKKYAFPGAGAEKTIVTVGFFEGINEMFIKISQ